MRSHTRKANDSAGFGVRRAAFRPDEPASYPPAPQRDAWDVPAALPWQQISEPGEWYAHDQARAGRRRHNGLFALIGLVSLCVITGALFSVAQAYAPYAAFREKAARMADMGFAHGVVVDGVSLGGLGFDEAAARMASGGGTATPRVNMLLRVDDTGFQITEAEVPFNRNAQALLDAAWSIGRQCFTWGVGSGMTPFEIRWRHALQTQAQGAYFQSEVSYDRSGVASLARAIAQQVTREPVNAVIQEFNFETRQFKVTRDVAGRRMDAEAIAQALLGALDAGQYEATLQLVSQPVLARVTSVDLQNGFVKLSSFSTKTDSNDDRNNNIALAASAMSNRTLMPGETFSFNGATGERTSAKGYRGAPAISGGVLIDDVGGGVCQVSSTVFNAAAMAGMTIVSRDPHAWPVSYLDRGLDATVNWPSLDFKFRNDKDTPVFIIAWYSNRRVHVEIYGMQTGPGETIALETRTLSTTNPPDMPLLQQNPALPYGTRQELKKARTGYVVDTYRVYLRGGAEYRREKLFTSNYRMVQQVIEYN